LNGVALLLLGVAVLGGCATSSAPQGFLVSAKGEQTDAFGGWIELEIYGTSARVLEGELIAVDGDSLFVLEEASGWELVALYGGEVREARLRGYDPGTGKYSAWTFLGTLSTVSHGYGLVLSAPIWLIGGSSATASQSKMADFEYSRRDVVEMRKFARFPAGMPEGVERGKLRPRWRAGSR
jgi:hypothetical protein